MRDIASGSFTHLVARWKSGPFAPPELPGITATMGPSESLLTSDAVMDSRATQSHEPDQQGLPGSDAFFHHPPSDSTPRSRKGACVDDFPFRAGFSMSDSLATPEL